MPTSDSSLQRMASAAATGQTQPDELCRQMTTYVHRKMHRSAFSTTLQTADQIAASLQGDCTEHAVLLATLMRIRGIPARVASGLIYTNQQYGFVGHMWVEAQINDTWIPFDSTVAPESSGVIRIRLADSDLPDSMTSGVSLFLPVMELAGRSKVRFISSE
ncbi:MAG: transglutaminase-like domain-containing protein [Planctomycetaceae bacterium]